MSAGERFWDPLPGGDGDAGENVYKPQPTVAVGDTVTVALTYVWGITAAGDPYYNAAGVTAGDEAVLVLDTTTGSYSLRPVEV